MMRLQKELCGPTPSESSRQRKLFRISKSSIDSARQRNPFDERATTFALKLILAYAL
jgi:hypothetical protein